MSLRAHRGATRRKGAYRPQVERLEDRTTPANVGYYDMNLGQGNSNQDDPILAAGHTPVHLTNLTAADLAQVEVLFVQNPSQTGYGAEYSANLGAIADFVAGGGTLILHDRYVEGAESILPGGAGFDIRRDINNNPNNVDIRTTQTTGLPIVGPGGTITNTNLDTRAASNGYAVASSLPAGAKLMLSRGPTSTPGLADQIVTFAYLHGKGYVIYSSNPLDFHLGGVNNMSQIYAPNVVAWGVDLLNIVPVVQDVSAETDEDGNITGNLDASDGDGDPLTFEIVQGASNGSVTLLNTATGSFVYTPAPNFFGTDTFTYRVNDGRDVSSVATVTVTVNPVNDPPEVDAGDNLVADEGVAVSASGTGFDVEGDPVTYTWDFGDGSILQGQAVSHAYADNGLYLVTVTADDGSGGVTTDTLTVTVNNVAPRDVFAGFDQEIDEGGTATFTGSFTDPGAADTHTLAWRVTDAAGLVVATGGGSAFSFTPADNGVFTVAFVVTDDDGGVGGDTAVVTARNVAPQGVSADADQTVTEGSPATFTATFTAPGSADTLTFGWVVTDDSGAVVATGSGASFSFNPADDGVFAVALTVTDDDGESGTATAVLTAVNAPPGGVTILGDIAVAEGGTATFTGSFTDPGADDTHTLEWRVTNAAGSVLATGSGSSFSFTPADDGVFTVALTVTDDGGDSATTSVVLTSTNVAPRDVSAGAAQAVDEGGTATFTGSFTDPGADTHTLSWAVTDAAGTVVATGSGASFAFTPDDNGLFTVTLTVTDDDGGSVSASAVLTSNNVAPQNVDAGADAAVNAGQPVTFVGSFTDPGTADTHLAQWRVVTAAGDVVGEGSGTSFTFTPTAAGTYGVVFTVTDDDGGTASDTAVLTVSAPNQDEVSITGPAAGVRGQTLYYQASLGSFTGDGVSKTWKVVNSGGHVVARGSGASFHYTSKKEGDFTVVFTASREDGSWSSAEAALKVTAVLVQADPFDPTKESLLVGGTTDDDKIVVKPGKKSGTVEVVINKKSQGTFSPTGRLFVYGQSGDDEIVLDARLSLPAVLSGGKGDDVLVGGKGADILLGEAGDDVLFGGLGRDIVIGGKGDDALVGSGDDVLIGGRTDFDEDFAALVSLLSEWNSSRGYATRANNIQGINPTADRLNGNVFLKVSGDDRTVHKAGDDCVVDFKGDLELRRR